MNRKNLSSITPLALIAPLVMAISACSFIPNYERPIAPIPTVWPDSAQLSNVGHSANVWQKYFPDPRLQKLIAVALENNRDLKIATARVAEARAMYGIQGADRFPTINLTGSHTGSLTPAAVSPSGVAFHTQRNDLNVNIVSYELDFWGRVRSLTAAAKANYLATEEAQRAFLYSLIADVANAYLSLEELNERTDLARATTKSRADTRDLISHRREFGLSSEMDFLQAEGAYQASLAELASLEQQQTAAGNLLNVLLGQSLSEIKDLPEGRSLKDQDITPATVAGLPSEVLLRRPDVQAAEQLLIASNANIGAARAAFFPRIALTGSVGTASNDLSGLFKGDNRAWSFQPSINVPLFDTGRTSDGVNVAKARKVIAVAQYEKTIQQAFREVADLLSASNKINEQLTAQAANAKAQSQRLVLVEARYKAGIASHLELLDAQRESFTASQGELQVRRMWLTVATQLYKALGGDTQEAQGSKQGENK